MTSSHQTPLVADRPIFVGGMFKSGTSLLRALLGQHPELFAGLETYWFEVKGCECGENQRIQWLAGFFGEAPEALQRLRDQSGNAEAFLDALMARAARSAGKSRWVEKTPTNLLHIQRILEAWPDSRFVHIVRDPRDILASQIEAGRGTVLDAAEARELADRICVPHKIAEFATTWTTMMRAAADFERDGGSFSQRYLSISYESLIRDTESAMRKVLAFSDTRWDPDVAHFNGRNDDVRLVRQITGRTSQSLLRLSRPLADDRVGIWRQILTHNDLTTLELAIAACGSKDLWARWAPETAVGMQAVVSGVSK